MSHTDDDNQLLRAAEIGGRDRADGYCKCAVVLRHYLESAGGIDESAEIAICNSGYEDREVARLYDGIRDLVKKGILEGRGDLELPAGPRYTECRITPAGKQALNTPGERDL